MKIFDTHTHDYFSDFDEDRKIMMQRDFEMGVFQKVQIGCDEITSKAALALAQEYHFCFATVGVHPCNVGNYRDPIGYTSEYTQKIIEETNTNEELFLLFEKMIEENSKKIIGIGETGFDFYHNDNPEMRALQEESFMRHIHLAKKYNKTLIIHTRNARNETLSFLNNYNVQLPKKGIIHCFSEDSDFAEIITNEYGYALGIGGIVTYKKAENIREAIKKTPLSFLVTETDSPYLAPQSVRGTRNQSKNIAEIIRCIAEVKDLEIEYCADALFENAIKTFQL